VRQEKKGNRVDRDERDDQIIRWFNGNKRCVYYEPNGKQAEFTSLIGTTKNMVSIESAANGTGKTSLVVNAIASIIWGPQTKWFDLPNFKNWTFPKRIRYITDPKLVEEIGPFHTEIEKWWPRGRYEAHKAGKSYFSQYKANGWVVDVMTLRARRQTI